MSRWPPDNKLPRNTILHWIARRGFLVPQMSGSAWFSHHFVEQTGTLNSLLGGVLKEILSAMQNMITDISGLLCDSAKSDCALKIASTGMKKTDQVIQDMMIANNTLFKEVSP